MVRTGSVPIDDFLVDEYLEAIRHKDTMEKIGIEIQWKMDDTRKSRYSGPKACPKRNFEPCLEDQCAMYVNEYPGRPWWGYCAFRNMSGR